MMPAEGRRARPLRPRRRFTVVAVFGLSLAATLLVTGCRSAPFPKPNVVLIVADDLGYGDLGSYGQQLIQTRRLDQMADEGMRFSNFHAGSAVCLPSRCTLMTGLHTGHCRIWNNWEGSRNSPSHKPLEEEDITVATVLSAAGYRTGTPFSDCRIFAGMRT